jgi:3-hydroxybutyryl-CoA dehydrogenase
MSVNLIIGAPAKEAFSPSQITILGAGLMGTALAVVHARLGLEVLLFDLDQSKLELAKDSTQQIFHTLLSSADINEHESKRFFNAIRFEGDLETALANTTFILEVITEKKDLKKVLFKQIDEIAAPEALICSNTSYLNVFEIVPERRLKNCLITHWYTPPYIIDLIDVVPSDPIFMPLANSVADYYRAEGKHPIVFKKFVAGYIANRLQSALNLEAFQLMENEGISAVDIDESIQYGLALRLLLLGQMKKADFTGLEMVRNGLATRAYQPPAFDGKSKILNTLLAQGRTGVSAGMGFYEYGSKSPKEIYEERDRQLLALKRLTNAFLDRGGL